MKTIISVLLICLIFATMAFANDFIMVTKIRYECTNAPLVFGEPEYRYWGEKIIVKKSIIKGVIVVNFAKNMKATEIQKKGENIYVYETPEEIFKLLKE